jgi:hypothetical protein
MRYFLPLLLCPLLLTVHPVAAAQAASGADDARNGRPHGGKMDCDGAPPWCKSGEVTCSPEMRGRCGKRRGDWYGASQPVATAEEARTLLLNYFAAQEYTVSEVTEKRWGFRAEIIGKDGKVVDRVMIDKRSGRIRSLN